MKNDIKKILLSEQEIEEIVEKIAKEIEKDYKDKKPLLVGLLKGCVVFMSDLSKKLDFKLELDYMDVSSYYGTQSSGVVSIDRDLKTSVENRHVLIVEDIVDTGRTLEKIKSLMKDRGASTVKVVTMLDKPEGRVVEIQADYVGATIPNEFVVGYGLDYNDIYRNLPYIGVLKEEIYSK